MTEAERKELKALADKKGLTMSAYIRLILKEKLAETKKSPESEDPGARRT